MPAQQLDELPLQHMGLSGTNFDSKKQSELTLGSVLQNVFEFSTFRTGQKEAIDMIMNGKDSVVVIPTGGGKTVIYSIPTLMIPGITVVVSPLLMLMHGQLLKLREKGINTCYLNSMLTKESYESVIANLSRPGCEYKILLTSPEVLLSSSVQDLLQKLK